MTDLSSLIERLEKLDEPSREADARIHYALFPDQEILLDPGDVRTRRPGKYGPLSKMPIDGWEDYPGVCMHIGAGRYTESIDAIVALIGKVLPGWGWRVATCSVSDDAWLFPDLNCPVHGERLRSEFPSNERDWGAYFVELTDVDLRPPGRPAIALCIALLQAIKEREGKPG